MARARAASWFSAVLRADAGALEAEDGEGDHAAVHLEEGAPELAVDAGDRLGAAVLDQDVEHPALHLGVEDADALGLPAAAEDGAALLGAGEGLQLLERRGGGVALAGEAAGRDAGGQRGADGGALRAAGAEQAAVAHQHEGAVGAGGDALGVDAEAGGRGDGDRPAGDVELGAGGRGPGAGHGRGVAGRQREEAGEGEGGGAEAVRGRHRRAARRGRRGG